MSDKEVVGRDKRATSLIINTAIIFFSKAASQLVGVFLLPLYTFSLAPSEYGLADLLLTYILLLIPLCSVQLEMATFRHLIDVRGDSKKEQHIVGASWALLLVMIGLVSVIASGAIVIFDIPYGWHALIAVVVGMILTFFQQIARGIGRIVDFAISGIVVVVGTVLISALLLVALQLKVEGVILGVAASNSLAIVYLFVRLRIWRGLRVVNDKVLQRRILAYALPLVPSTISWWAIGAFGRTIITVVLGVASAGLYAAAYRFTMLFSGIPYVFNLSWTESASLSVSHNDRDEYYSRIANASLKIFCVAAGVMLLLIGAAFDWLIDSAYRQAYGIIPILMLGLLINAMASYYHAIFAAHRDTKFIAMSSIVAALVSIVVSLSLVNSGGIYGVSIGAVAGYSVMTGWCLMRVKKHADIKFNQKNVIGSTLFFVVASIIYYTGDWTVVVIGAIIMASGALFVYRRDIHEGIAGIARRIKRASKGT